MILNAPVQGMGIDSAWRNKSDTQAPMTAMITVDDAGHLALGKWAFVKLLYQQSDF
jgi:hypothetical protein